MCPSRFLLKILYVGAVVSEQAPCCHTLLAALGFLVCYVRMEGSCCSLVESTHNSKKYCSDTEWLFRAGWKSLI